MGNSNQSFMPKLIFLCIITTSIVTTLSLSKYQSTVTGSANSVSVAKPEVEVTVNTDGIYATNNGVYSPDDASLQIVEFSVTNIGEVSIKYSIDFTNELDDSVLDTFNITFTNGKYNANSQSDSTTNSYKYYDETTKPNGELKMGETVIWHICVTKNYNLVDEIVTPKIKIKCNAEQVD